MIMMYILIALIGVIVGMLIIITFNAINENVKEKQYLRNMLKKRNPNKIRKMVTN